jgi:hypothetical protein
LTTVFEDSVVPTTTVFVADTVVWEEAVVDDCRDETASATCTASATLVSSKLRTVGSSGALDEAASSADAVAAVASCPTSA